MISLQKRYIKGSKPKYCFVLISQSADEDLEGVFDHILIQDSFVLVAAYADDPSNDLCPWLAKGIFSKDDFGDGANDSLRTIVDEIIPELKKDYGEETRFILGGYSLGALFSLWAAYNTDIFYGHMCASPSLWYPLWDEYIAENKPLAKRIYLSLGDKEKKSKNKVLATVEDRVLQQEEQLKKNDIERSVLEFNEGNHFKDVDIRIANGFNWLVEEHLRIKGPVVHGKGLGHTKKMPTANVDYGKQALPPNGVYATKVVLEDGRVYKGVTNVGTRPSVDNDDLITIETFIIDFAEDIYDKTIELVFGRYLREIRKFSSLDELKMQVDKDIEDALRYCITTEE